MDLIQFREYCLSLPRVEESTPFDEETLVYKVGGKMFACASMDSFDRVAVKCPPEEAERLREEYAEIIPARYFNKRHWNSIPTAGDLPDDFLRRQILRSYLLVARHSITPKALRKEILAEIGRCGLDEE